MSPFILFSIIALAEIVVLKGIMMNHKRNELTKKVIIKQPSTLSI